MLWSHKSPNIPEHTLHYTDAKYDFILILTALKIREFADYTSIFYNFSFFIHRISAWVRKAIIHIFVSTSSVLEGKHYDVICNHYDVILYNSRSELCNPGVFNFEACLGPLYFPHDFFMPICLTAYLPYSRAIRSEKCCTTVIYGCQAVFLSAM